MAIAGAVLALELALPSHEAGAAFPGANGPIVFESDRHSVGNDTDVYVMNTDGTNPVDLTNDATGDDVSPAWSADRTKIAFESNRSGNGEVYVMDADGTDQVNRTNNSALDRDPTWSPDGARVAFWTDRDGNQEIYVMDADGTDQVNLSANGAVDNWPAWSPAGTHIAFASTRIGSTEIWVMEADGSDQVRLTDNAASDFAPTWSPDGTKIAFTSNRDGNNEIYVMDSDGTDQVNVTNNAGSDFAAAWSPDGAKIAFSSTRDGNVEVYVMDADGTDQQNLTQNAAADTSPDWASLPPADPPPTDPDTDGDGVPDSQDLCPMQAANTPDGCPVNTPPPAVDTTAPVLEARAKKRQIAGRPIKLKLSADEDARALAKGKIVVRILETASAAATVEAKRFALKPRRAQLVAGEDKVLKLRPKGSRRKSRRTLRKIRRLVLDGAKARAKLRATATDAAGNDSRTVRVKVTLVR